MRPSRSISSPTPRDETEDMDINDIDLSELRAIWEQRRANAAAYRARVDWTGATRPPRDPDEREFLRSRGLEGPFVEVDSPGWADWRNPPREETQGTEEDENEGG